MSRIMRVLLLLTLAIGITTSTPAAEEEEEEKGWRNETEFSWVATEGNTDTSTFGLKSRTWRRWTKSNAEFLVGGIRGTAAPDRFAVGDAGDFVVVEPGQLVTTESYYARGQYFRDIRENFQWNAGAGWNRDRFSGVQNRYQAWGGLANIWFDKDKLKWRTDYSLAATHQEDVIDDPTRSDTYASLRLASVFVLGFGENGFYTNDTIFDQNLDNSTDWRVDMTNSVSVTMTKKLALRASLQWLYRNDPSLTELLLFELPVDNPGDQVGTVIVPLEKLDTILTTSLVVGF